MNNFDILHEFNSNGELAGRLGGETNGHWINSRGPGHSSKDRSLGIIFDPKAPDGFRVNSLAGDDHSACRTYVKGCGLTFVYTLMREGRLKRSRLVGADSSAPRQSASSRTKQGNTRISDAGAGVPAHARG
jgi:hypothetical protein